MQRLRDKKLQSYRATKDKNYFTTCSKNKYQRTCIHTKTMKSKSKMKMLQKIIFQNRGQEVSLWNNNKTNNSLSTV